jgi:ribose 5-phosphate isomerase RpiB
VLSLGSKTIDPDAMRAIVSAFLESELTEDRHARRVAKIDEVDRRFLR